MEGIALADKFLTKFLVVVDDSVVNTDDGAVIRAVRVSIVLGRLAVGSPASVSDTA